MPDTEAPRRGHLHQVDVVRLLTFAAVIVVHSIAFTESPASRPWAGALMLLQFGREVFFALTGFVLVYSARGELDSRRFWRRRVPFVLAPYLAWSGIYTVWHRWGPLHAHLGWRAILGDLVTGNAEYHLYFLLVTLQLYLVFPVLLRFVRRTAARCGPVLAVVGGLNLAWLGWLQYGHAPANWVGQLWPRAYELLPSYAVYVLIGAYAAVHLDTVERVVRTRRRALVGVAGACALGAEAVFWAQVSGRDPRVAAAVLQPAMFLTCVASLIGLYLAGTAWNRAGRPAGALMNRASDLSFAVYLAHPLVLEVLLRLGLGNDGQRLPAPLATVLAVLGTTAGAIALSVVARRSRWTLWLTGRPRPVVPDVHEVPIPVTEPSQVGSRR